VFAFVLSILILSIFGHFFFTKAYAEIIFKQSPNPICQDTKDDIIFTFEGTNKNEFIKNKDYTLGVWKERDADGINIVPLDTFTYRSTDIDGQNLSPANPGEKIDIGKWGKWQYKLWFGPDNGLDPGSDNFLISGDYMIYPRDACTLGLPILEMDSPARTGDPATITVRNINPNENYLLWFIFDQQFNSGKFSENHKYQVKSFSETLIDSEGNSKTINSVSLLATLDSDKPGKKTLCLKHGKTTLGFGKSECEISIKDIEITNAHPGTTVKKVSSEYGTPLSESSLFSNPPKANPPLSPCAQWANLKGTPIPAPSTDASEIKCIFIDTAIGPIDTQPQAFVRRIFSLVLGLAGGIALLLIMYAGYQMMASSGNAEKITEARARLMSAIVGLLFIIFSFVILQIIGVDILRIPGFTP